MKPKSIFKKKNINTSDYVNRHTGELMESELPNITSVNIKNDSLSIVDFDEYIIMDSKALRYIQSIFTNVDLARIYRLSNMIRGVRNILHDNNGKPHSLQSLRLSLDYDASEFSRFMKRLHTKSIIHYIEGYKDNRKCRWIMLNPYLCRKGKVFHHECLCVFDDLSKKYAA